MKILKKEIKNNKTYFKVEVDKTLWANEQQKTYKRSLKNLSVSGFRKGHVPTNIANEAISQEDIINGSLNEAISITIDEFLLKRETLDEKIDLDSIKIDVEDITKDKLIVVLIYENIPEVISLKYDGIKINYTKPIISEKEVNVELSNLLKKDITLSPKKDGTIATGDVVTFDFKGFLNDLAFPGGEAKGHELEIGSNQFIPGFEEKMVGLKKGDKKSIEISFPESYHSKDLAGKKTRFDLNIIEVNSKTNPVLDEKYIKTLGIPGVKTEKELFSNIEEQIFKYKNYSAKQSGIEEISKYLINNIKLSFEPTQMILTEKENVLKYTEDLAKKENLTIKDYALKTMRFKKMEEFDAYIEEQAKNVVNLKFSIKKLNSILKISFTKEELDIELQGLSSMHNVPLQELLNNSKAIEQVSAYLIKEKLFDKLIELNSKQK